MANVNAAKTPADLILEKTSTDVQDTLIEKGLMDVFSTAVKGGDASGAARAAAELRIRKEAKEQKAAQAAAAAKAAPPYVPGKGLYP